MSTRTADPLDSLLAPSPDLRRTDDEPRDPTTQVSRQWAATAIGRHVGDPSPAELARDRFGGVNWGPACLGWLVTLALTTLTAGVVAVTVLVVDRMAPALLPFDPAAPSGDAVLAGVGCAAGLLGLAHFVGGYVAGRMSRYDGARQGLAVFTVGLLVTLLALGTGLALLWTGDQVTAYEPPALALDPTGLVAVLGGLLVTAALAALGGRVGRRYHDRVDALRRLL